MPSFFVLIRLLLIVHLLPYWRNKVDIVADMCEEGIIPTSLLPPFSLAVNSAIYCSSDNERVNTSLGLMFCVTGGFNWHDSINVKISTGTDNANVNNEVYLDISLYMYLCSFIVRAFIT